MDTPKPPDPAKTAAAQSGANRDTAISESLINQYDQIGPQGSIKYDQSGFNEYTDSLTGKTVRVPKFTQTTAYSPEYQGIFDTNTQTQANIANIGRDQSGRIGELLGTNLDLSPERVASYADQRYKPMLDEEWNSRAGSFESQLINKGVRPGSVAYDRAMSGFSKDRENAYSNRSISAYDQAINSILKERSAPIDEISALLSGSQVNNPQFQSTPQTGVAGTDYMGAVNNNYNAQVNSANAFNSGLFGIAGAGLGGWASGAFGNPFARKTA